MKKVLVVDDNEEILNVISIVLDMEGYDVKCLDNGLAVPELLLSYSPNLILLDIMLGGMDGRDLCKAIKSDPSTGHIPIVMISASHNLYDSSEMNCMADDFIAKPFDIAHLASMVQKHVN
jgi:CheY-like chemotaxis protein